MEFKDYYSTLGVAKSASDKEIKQAFRKLARKFHPDVNPGDKAAEARFKEINEAHEVLSDPDKRKKYDELGANWRQYENAPAGAAGAPFGGQWNWGESGGFRPMTEEEVSEMFGGESGSPFSDFFNTFFGGAEPAARRGRSPRGRPRAHRGRDVEHEFDLDLEPAAHGSVQRLSLRHDGEARTVEVRIPPGVVDGSRVRVAGEGRRGTGGGPSGDLFLRIRLKPHPRFQVSGRDLTTRLAVPLTTAILGGETEVVTLAGKTLRLKVPPGSQPGQKMRLRGQGLPALGQKDDAGDLFVVLDVALPRTLTEDERRLYEELAALDARGHARSESPS